MPCKWLFLMLCIISRISHFVLLTYLFSKKWKKKTCPKKKNWGEKELHLVSLVTGKNNIWEEADLVTRACFAARGASPEHGGGMVTRPRAVILIHMHRQEWETSNIKAVKQAKWDENKNLISLSMLKIDNHLHAGLHRWRPQAQGAVFTGL